MENKEKIEELLKNAGLSVTLQRLSLVDFILKADHPTADDILSWAKKNLAKVNTATIYNTLNCLENAKIIKKLKFPHTAHFVYDHNTHDHFHFLDEDSGKIIDLPKEAVNIEHSLGSQFNINKVDILLKGTLKK